MTPWLTAIVLGLCAVLLVVLLVLLARDTPAEDRTYVALGVAELALVAQVVVGCIALAGTERDVNGVLFVSYLVGNAVALPIGAFWSLAERGRAGTGVLLLAVLTVAALQVRLGAIWGGQGA